MQRQRCNRFAQVVVPKAVAECGEKKRRRFAADAREGEQNPRNDSPGRGLHNNKHNGFPARDAQRESGFAIPDRHKKNHFFGGAQDQRDHDLKDDRSCDVRVNTERGHA